MSVSERFLHPEAIKRIARLDLRARRIVDGFLAGTHRSPRFGQSVEFRQHRQYTFGDDLRHVDWKVWAKQDRFYVKQFEEDTNLRATLVVDVSASMQYGSGAMSKYEYAATAAVSLAYLLLRHQDAVGCVVFDEDVRATVPQRTRPNHLDSIIRSLDASQPREKTDPARTLRRVAQTQARRGLIILVSDLLADREAWFRGLRLLRGRGHDLVVLHVMDDDELDFAMRDPTRFEGLEADAHLQCDPRALREGYLEALDAFLRQTHRACARNDADYLLMRTSQPLDAALATLLHRRAAAT